MPYVILFFLWVGWCGLHSGLITKSVTEYLQLRLGKWAPYYRLFYNGMALVTLMPVVGYTFSIEKPPVFCWDGWLHVFQGLLLVLAGFLFMGGAKRYDLAQFIGLRQIREGKSCSALTDNCRLDTSGVLNVVRHPWYAGGIFLVWARNLDVTAIVVNLVISGYFILGAVLEEKKLMMEYGTEYRAYQRRVSMLIPVKWIFNHWRS